MAEAENARIAVVGGGKGPEAQQRSVPQQGISGSAPFGAPEQFDAVQGPVQPGDPYSPHAIIQHDVPGRAAYDQANRDIAGLSDGGDPEPSVTYAQGSQS